MDKCLHKSAVMYANISFGIDCDNAWSSFDKKYCLTLNKANMSEVKIKPLGDRVLVEPLSAEVKTSSGIIIPDSAKEKPQKGTIVAAVGPGTK